MNQATTKTIKLGNMNINLYLDLPSRGRIHTRTGGENLNTLFGYFVILGLYSSYGVTVYRHTHSHTQYHTTLPTFLLFLVSDFHSFVSCFMLKLRFLSFLLKRVSLLFTSCH